MGRDRFLPAVLAKVHPKYQTSYTAIVFIGILALLCTIVFSDT
jgi:amino acid transporter